MSSLTNWDEGLGKACVISFKKNAICSPSIVDIPCYINFRCHLTLGLQAMIGTGISRNI